MTDEERTLHRETEAILDAVLIALRHKQGSFSAFPVALCAAVELLLQASLLAVRGEDRRAVQDAMAVSLEVAAGRLRSATTRDCEMARTIVRQAAHIH